MQGSRPRGRSRWPSLRAAAFLGCLALQACAQRPEVVIHAATGPVRITVEVAATPEARARGLMYRRDLAADAGMLFVFPSETPQQFWMKNTPLPLDMVFIGSNLQVVGVVADTRPFSTNPLGVPAPSQFVLEVHAGFCARHGIDTGARVEFAGIPSTQQ